MPSYPTVYSVPFIVRAHSDPLASFLVPDNQTAVIRDFTAAETVGGAIYQVMIQDSEAAPTVVVAQLGTLGVAEYAQWTGRVVVPGGGLISCQGTFLEDTADIYVGGYLLTNYAL